MHSRTQQAEAEQKNYWKTALGARPSSFLFPKLNPTCTSTQRTNFIQMNALPSASEMLQQSRSLGLSLQSVFLAAWAITQSSYTKGSHEAIFGLWNAGRNADVEGLEDLDYPCMNVLPFCIRFGNDMTPRDKAVLVQEELMKRTPIVEQSNLVDIDEWVHGHQKPLHNVFVNILGLPGMGGSIDEVHPLLQPLEVCQILIRAPFIPN